MSEDKYTVCSHCNLMRHYLYKDCDCVESKAAKSYESQLSAAQSENARLREALEEIADNDLRGTYLNMRCIAREALGRKEGE